MSKPMRKSPENKDDSWVSYMLNRSYQLSGNSSFINQKKKLMFMERVFHVQPALLDVRTAITQKANEGPSKK